MYKAVKFRLYPTKSQEVLLYKNCGCCRLVWNHFLSRKKEAYRNKEKLTLNDMMLELTQLKKQFPFLAEANAQSLQQTIKDLDRAFQNFFRNLKNGTTKPRKPRKDGELPGYPRFKSYGRKEAFRIPQFVEMRGNKIFIQKHGEITLRGSFSQLNGKINSATIKLEADEWFVSCLYECQTQEIEHKYSECGIDVGIKNPIYGVFINNDGEIRDMVSGEKESKHLKELEKRRKFYQRRRDNTKKGSKGRERWNKKVAKAYQKERNYRNNWVEFVSCRLTDTFQQVKVENLNLKNMTKSSKGTVENPGTMVKQKSGLNRELLRLSYGRLVTRLEQKSSEKGGWVVKVNPRNTSRKCSVCSFTSKENRKTQEKFECVQCGHQDNADRNAALNILFS